MTDSAKQYAKAIKDAPPGTVPHIPIDEEDARDIKYPAGSKLADPKWTGDKKPSDEKE